LNLLRDCIFVEDNCRAIQTVLEEGHVYNLGGGSEKRNIDITDEILRRLSLPENRIELVAYRPGHDLRYSGLREVPSFGLEDKCGIRGRTSEDN
jgi:dTDP-glucose 4,6-dehydratase